MSLIDRFRKSPNYEDCEPLNLPSGQAPPPPQIPETNIPIPLAVSLLRQIFCQQVRQNVSEDGTIQASWINQRGEVHEIFYRLEFIRHRELQPTRAEINPFEPAPPKPLPQPTPEPNQVVLSEAKAQNAAKSSGNGQNAAQKSYRCPKCSGATPQLTDPLPGSEQIQQIITDVFCSAELEPPAGQGVWQ